MLGDLYIVYTMAQMIIRSNIQLFLNIKISAFLSSDKMNEFKNELIWLWCSR